MNLICIQRPDQVLISGVVSKIRRSIFIVFECPNATVLIHIFVPKNLHHRKNIVSFSAKCYAVNLKDEDNLGQHI